MRANALSEASVPNSTSRGDAESTAAMWSALMRPVASSGDTFLNARLRPSCKTTVPAESQCADPCPASSTRPVALTSTMTNASLHEHTSTSPRSDSVQDPVPAERAGSVSTTRAALGRVVVAAAMPMTARPRRKKTRSPAPRQAPGTRPAMRNTDVACAEATAKQSSW